MRQASPDGIMLMCKGMLFLQRSLRPWMPSGVFLRGVGGLLSGPSERSLSVA
jgi:hypothetical protein